MVDIRSQLEQYENKFRKNKYDGNGKKPFLIKEGRIPIMLSAPHAVNHYRYNEEQQKISEKKAEVNTGAITELLHRLTGCHIIYAQNLGKTDPNYDTGEQCSYKQALKQYVQEHDIKLVLDLHGARETRDFAVDIGTIDEKDSSLKGYPFIVPLITYWMEYYFHDLPQPNEVKKNCLFKASYPGTVTNYISTVTQTACVQLEINWNYRDLKNKKQVESLLEALKAIIFSLEKEDWRRQN